MKSSHQRRESQFRKSTRRMETRPSIPKGWLRCIKWPTKGVMRRGRWRLWRICAGLREIKLVGDRYGLTGFLSTKSAEQIETPCLDSEEWVRLRRRLLAIERLSNLRSKPTNGPRPPRTSQRKGRKKWSERRSWETSGGPPRQWSVQHPSRKGGDS